MAVGVMKGWEYERLYQERREWQFLLSVQEANIRNLHGIIAILICIIILFATALVIL